MNRQKIISYLGFAQKAGKVVIGFDNVANKKYKRFPLILVCKSASDRTKNEVIHSDKATRIIVADNVAELTNRTGCKVIAVTDENLAKAIINEFSQN
ncbi:MAG: L7Ae/L30e/S12e/Gadd45 family ribosomal protein [Christensenellales bacterium]